MTPITSSWEEAVDTIVSCRKGSMDENQFRATVEHNIREEKALSEREGYGRAIKGVGMLRQWLNEDRITEPGKMVTNEEIMTWLNP